MCVVSLNSPNAVMIHLRADCKRRLKTENTADFRKMFIFFPMTIVFPVLNRNEVRCTFKILFFHRVRKGDGNLKSS